MSKANWITSKFALHQTCLMFIQWFTAQFISIFMKSLTKCVQPKQNGKQNDDVTNDDHNKTIHRAGDCTFHVAFRFSFLKRIVCIFFLLLRSFPLNGIAWMYDWSYDCTHSQRIQNRISCMHRCVSLALSLSLYVENTWFVTWISS